jgi:arylsulfatase A-like enzyme
MLRPFSPHPKRRAAQGYALHSTPLRLGSYRIPHKALVGGMLLMLFALWAKTPLQAQTTTAAPNILYIIVDDLNDYLWAGDQRPNDLPNLAALAAEGVRYDACYSTSPLCGPSRVSFLTGKDPDWTGVYRNQYVKFFRKYFGARPVMTSMEHLREEGYYTVGINKVFHNLPRAQFDNDFDASESDPLSRDLSWNEFLKFKDLNYTLEEPAHFFEGTGYRWGRIIDAHEDRMADTRAVGGAIAVLSRYADDPADFGGRPLMLTLGIVKPHTPHMVPAKYFPPQFEGDLLSATTINYQTTTNPGGWPLPDYGPGGAQAVLDQMHPAAEIMSTQNGNHQGNTEAWALAQDAGAPLTAEGLRKGVMANANMAYMATARYVDAQIGRLLFALDSLGLESNTVVVFHSDHGFAQGEHRHWAKKALWETDSRVPLIIKDPRESGGQVVRTPVSLLDVFPTLCDLAGVDYPTVDGNPDYLDGRSVWPLRNNPISSRAAHSLFEMNDDPSLYCGLQRSVFEGDWHLIQMDYRPSGDCSDPADTVELLFNLAEDPYEWEDLSTGFANRGILDYLRTRIEEPTPQDRWTLKITHAGSDTVDQDDAVSFSAQLYDADGVPVSPTAGTTILWQLAPFPYNTATGTSASFHMNTLPLSVLADASYLRVHAYWLDFSTREILGFDTKSLHLDLSGAPLAKTLPKSVPSPEQPLDCDRWFDLLGRPIEGPIPGQVSFNACGQGIWQAGWRTGRP